MYKIVLLLLLTLGEITFAQQHEYVYRNPNNKSFNCYLSLLPESKEIKGLIIRDYSSLPDINKKSRYRWMELALEQGMAIVFTVSSNYFPDLFYDDAGPKILDEILHEVVDKYKIPKEHIFIGGISASGTRALRFAQFCNEGKSKYKHQIQGVFAVDSPLDIERFYNAAKNHKKYYHPYMKEEAELILKAFPEKLNGTPESNLKNYRKASVFSASDTNGANASHYLNTSILLIHEPDIDWWLHERGASYYDFNSYDIAGFVICLKALKHKDIEMISTTGKGFDKNGNRNCHSWTIVDEDYLIKWILERIESN